MRAPELRAELTWLRCYLQPASEAGVACGCGPGEDGDSALARRFITERMASGEVDFVRALAWELPALVVLRILGIPDEDVPAIKAGAESRLLFMWGRPTEKEQLTLAQGMARFWRYAEALVAARFSAPGDRRHRHWHFLGSALTLYVTWQAAVAFGVLAGASVPSAWSLDFAVVLCFIALLIPALKSRADLAAAIVAGAVALVAAGLPYRLSLVVASIAGIAAGLAIELRHEGSK